MGGLLKKEEKDTLLNNTNPPPNLLKIGKPQCHVRQRESIHKLWSNFAEELPQIGVTGWPHNHLQPPNHLFAMEKENFCHDVPIYFANTARRKTPRLIRLIRQSANQVKGTF